MTDGADLAVAAAFHDLAAGYDEEFSNRPLGRALRRRTWREFEWAFPVGACLLDIGCGTGEDAVHLARAGRSIHGVDVAPGMIERARAKAAAAGVADRAIFVVGSATDLTGLASARFDGAYANFGSLNCVPDLPALGRHLRRLLVPGAPLVVVVMGPVCPWEWLYYGKRGHFAKGLRRLRRADTYAHVGGNGIRVVYPWPRELARALGSEFQLERVHSLGSVLPPSYASGPVEARPGVFGACAALDAMAAPWAGRLGIGDHYIARLTYARKRAAARRQAPQARYGQPLPSRDVDPVAGWQLACPQCGGRLDPAESTLRCSGCLRPYEARSGVWQLLTDEAQARHEQFIIEYAAVRQAEGRHYSPAELRALPAMRPGHPRQGEWSIRRASYRVLAERILPDLGSAPLRIVDVGAGTAWLSNCLAGLGHYPLAVDLSIDRWDGLGAAVAFDEQGRPAFPRVQGEFDRLPLADGAANIAIFNASLHYAPSLKRAVGEALRVVGRRGAIVIMDTALYPSHRDGRAMVAERRAVFQERFGFPSDAHGGQEYLTPIDLQCLADEFGLAWRVIRPWYGLAYALRPWQAVIRGRRRPSQFAVLVATPNVLAGASLADTAMTQV